jgi:hypothetical protein
MQYFYEELLLGVAHCNFPSTDYALLSLFRGLFDELVFNFMLNVWQVSLKLL